MTARRQALTIVWAAKWFALALTLLCVAAIPVTAIVGYRWDLMYSQLWIESGQVLHKRHWRLPGEPFGFRWDERTWTAHTARDRLGLVWPLPADQWTQAERWCDYAPTRSFDSVAPFWLLALLFAYATFWLWRAERPLGAAASQSRLRRRMCRIGLAVSIATYVVMLVSVFVRVSINTTHIGVTVAGGGACIQRHSPGWTSPVMFNGRPIMVPAEPVEPFLAVDLIEPRAPMAWFVAVRLNRGVLPAVVIPLWLPTFMILLPTAAGYIRAWHPPPNACRKCDYNLTGNVSGVCPECGTVVMQSGQKALP